MSPLVQAALSLACLCFVAAEDPAIEIASGKLSGESVEFSHRDVDIVRKVNIFRGVPYAKPPVGDLRFRPPQTDVRWDGVYRATTFGSACIQAYDPLEPITEPQSEDCLYLNVYVPETTDSGPLPVMVWIHGGVFYKGSGAKGYDNGTPLAAIGEVIVVTLNYRLGPLGFLSTGDEYAPGNYGLLDQMAALQWVHDNIEAFGGDNKKVTIFGESAGSMSSDYLLLSPLTNGLFQRVIMQSGNAPIKGFFGTDSHLQRRTAHALGTVLGCERETTDELIRCLRNLPSEDFKEPSDNNKAKGMIENIIGQELGLVAFPPVIDDYFLTEDPSTIVEKMSFPNSGIDIMLGNLADEGMYFVSVVLPEMWNEPGVSMSRTVYESHVNTFLTNGKMRTDPAVQEAIRLMYVNWENADFDDADYVDSLSQQLGDMYFVCPTDISARAYAKAGFNVYKYHITHTPSKSFWPLKWMKAAHAEDIPIVFGWHFVDGMDWDVSKEEVNMILTVMKYWTNFAKTGNPNLPNEDTTLSEEEVKGMWPLFKVPGLAYKELSLKMETKRALKAKECAFWNDFIPKLMSIKDSAEKCSPDDDEPRKYAEEANINQ